MRRTWTVAALVLAVASVSLSWIEAQQPPPGGVAVAFPAGVHARQPQLAVADGGTVHLTAAAGESIYHAVSRDGGRSFPAATRVAELPGLMAGKRRGPRIVANADTTVISAISRAGNLVAWRATNGSAWEGPATVNDVDKSAREGLHALAMGPKGEIACVWLDLRSGSMEIAASTSHDGGATWSPNIVVYKSPDGHVCECCHPSAVYDAKGALLVMWRNWLGGNRDMFLASSADGGRTFSPAKKLGDGAWKLNACPMDGGGLALLAPGKAATAWRREGTVYATTPDSTQERRLGPGEQPVIAAVAGKPVVAWVSRRGGDLLVWQGEGRSLPVKLANSASDPTLAAASGKGPAILAWESGSGPTMTIRVVAIGDSLPVIRD